MPKKIDEELQARAVRLANEHLSEYPSLTAVSAAVAKQLGVGKESVRRWVVQAPGRRRPTPGSHYRGAGRDQDAQGQGSKVGRGQRDLDGRDGFLRRGTRPPQPLIMGFVETMRAEGHAVESICRVLREQGCQVAARTYRSWRRAGRPVAARTMSEAQVVDAVRDVAWATDQHGRRKLTPEGLYGRRKMTAYLRRTAMPETSAGSVDRAMRTLGLVGVRRDNGTRITIPARDGNRAGDLLDRDFTAAAPNLVWVTDFTYSAQPRIMCSPAF